ncbi:DUF3667 domain-containing protein [Polaribacter marinus]|uniref:DUF3667 domain-containing protein n=1 Tax=Polaribacter marinus TaxID=2916838 RepID=UPI003B8461E0
MIKLIRSKKKLSKIKDPECLNCGYPFNGHEKFCPDCGQENKGNKITFLSFIHEVFNGLFNFDAKFWRTIIPLLIKPGVVSRNYIEGKRQRYSNPFRFYLTVSIIFFLILGISKSIDKFKELKNGDFNKEARTVNNDRSNKKEVNIDSLKNVVNTELKNSWIPIDSLKRNEIVNQIAENAKDSTKNKKTGIISFGEGTRLDHFISFQKKYPDIEIDRGLDSLKYEKTFFNRFLYSRAKVANTFIKKDAREQFLNQLLSYGSVALFLFLPFFTLFLKFFYIRKKYTYVDHLVFVFHTQTVFFMLLSIYFLLELFNLNPEIWIFVVLFLVYLLIAMRKFYQQGYFKTFIKFCMLNIAYLIISSIGVTIVFLISFALY